MTFSGAHQRPAREGERGVQATDWALLLLALLLKKIHASLWLCVTACFVCTLGGCVFFPQTDRGSMKINNVSFPPEVLNLGV